MDRYTLTGEHYLHPTPAGAYYAVSRPSQEPARRFLLRLLTERRTPPLTAELLAEWAGLGEQDGLEFIYRLQSSGFIQGLPMALDVPDEPLERLLPPLLAQLSDEGRAVLAEKRGLNVSAAGYPHEAIEELAALGADLVAVYDRHQQLLRNNLRVRGEGWGLMNAGGFGEIGFWPLYLGPEYFILVIGGMPQFNQSAFTLLAWALGVRYGGS